MVIFNRKLKKITAYLLMLTLIFAGFSIPSFSAVGVSNTPVPVFKNNALVVGDVYVEDYIDVGGWPGVLDLAMQRTEASGAQVKVYYLYSVGNVKKIFDLTDRNVTSFTSHPGTGLSWNDIKGNIKFTYDGATGNLIPCEEYIEPPIEINDQPLDLGKLYQLISEGLVDVVLDEDDAVIKAIEGQFTTITVNNESDALRVFLQIAPLLGLDINDASDIFSVSDIAFESVGSDDYPGNVYRMNPTVNGIPIFGGDIILSVSDEGVVLGVFTSYNSDINDIDSYPTITPDDAEQIVLNAYLTKLLDLIYSQDINASDEEIEEFFKLIIDYLDLESELIVYNLDKDSAPVLAYAVNVSSKTFIIDDDPEAEEPYEVSLSLPYIETLYYVYANGVEAGNIFESMFQDVSAAWTPSTDTGYDLIGRQRPINIETSTGVFGDTKYRLRDYNRRIETYKTSFINLIIFRLPSIPGKMIEKSSNFWNAAGVSSHYSMEQTYNYYKDILNRESYDGAGATVISSVEYEEGHWGWWEDYYENAAWSSRDKQFIFGDKDCYASALDIVAHEYTHAVINTIVGGRSLNTSLTYKDQSGALNESYADILGSLIEGRTGEDRWLIGEDLNKGAIRRMRDPSQYNFNDRDHMLNYYTGSNQNYGVHHNSGIFNFAAYKMMVDGRTSGITDEDWAKIFFASLYYLTPNAEFIDARIAVTHALRVYFGKTDPTGGYNNGPRFDFLGSSFYNPDIYDWIPAVNDAFVAVGITIATVYRSTDLFNLNIWDVYEHTGYKFSYIYPQPPDRPHSIVQVGTRSIGFLGFNIEGYKDFLYMPNNDPDVKTFFFDLVREDDYNPSWSYQNWHSIEGGGFLFNTTIDKANNIIEGYCILVTENATLKLVKINSTDLSDFRDGWYDDVEYSGYCLKTASIPGVGSFDNMSFIIRVSSTEISVWCNGVRVLDKETLPTASASYGFGPIVSHRWHGCEQLSGYTFSNIVMESK